MATILRNRAGMTTATTGTGTITLGSAILGYQSFATSGVADGESCPYVIVDGSDFEVGVGTYTSSGTTLTRSVTKSSNSGSAINLSGNAQVFLTARKEDIRQPPLGVNLRINPALTAQNMSVTNYYVPWNTVVYEDIECWSVGVPTKIFVPTGMRWADVWTQLNFNNMASAASDNYTYIEYYTSSDVLAGYFALVMWDSDGGTDPHICLTTRRVPVTPGYYFKVRHYNPGDSSIDLTTASLLTAKFWP